ncbi:MAG: TylF/MycF family methyltransferase [Acidimicrobiia bacterium]
MSNELATRYIELLQGCLSRSLFIDEEPHHARVGDALSSTQLATVREHDWEIVTIGGDRGERAEGRDWPPYAETMIGDRRLDNVVACVTELLADGIPGDLIETGAWRGGATILMRGILAAHGVTDRRVWVADSFEGLPAPDAARYPADEGVDLSGIDLLKVTAERVKANFERYGLLDDQVQFLEGWFRDTLPDAPIDSLALIRLDGDLYESTMDALTALYPKLSPGGFVIVDDYGAFEPCRQAISDYRDANGIDDPITEIDWTGVYWRRALDA